jgi:peptide/nickel transport system substrate-binding protein
MRSSWRRNRPPTTPQSRSAPAPSPLTEWVKGDRVDLGRNDGYWGTPVKLDKVTFKFISDPTAAFAAMMAGDLDAYPVFPAPETWSSSRPIRAFQVIIGSSEGETILAMNNKKAPLDNIKVREAIAHAIDRQAIIDGAMFGYGTPIGTHFAPHNPGLCRSDGAVGL